MKIIKKLSLVLVLVLVITLFAGCGKENKYVNVGIEMSTAGLSLYLTNTAVGLEKISTYVFFPENADETFDKISKDKQGIDITYIPVKELSRIKKDSNFRVVFIDSFDENGELKGVWIARDGWLKEAPNYSKRYLRGLVKSTDYRASHFNMTYPEALDSIKGMRDFDFEKQNEVMQFVAVFAESNKDTVDTSAFTVRTSDGLSDMFKGFDGGSGEGYELCKAAYDRYCGSSDAMSFEDMFKIDMMLEAINAVKEDK